MSNFKMWMRILSWFVGIWVFIYACICFVRGDMAAVSSSFSTMESRGCVLAVLILETIVFIVLYAHDVFD